jgi:PAS domain S-box-containing protein
MNPVAEKLTGWSSREAEGGPLLDVFRILNEYTRKLVTNPVDKVLRKGAVVGLANHTVLVRRDGTDVPIDDSAAPIRDAIGNLFGVVLVFRDATGEKREEARREFLARDDGRLPRLSLDRRLVGRAASRRLVRRRHHRAR